jgi:NAD(P)-dependent dehydrogenase (short-subunit alcohol dehydrogenase family)
MELFDLSGRVAVVTGGNGGIGLGMALGMARAGATIVVAGRDAAKNAAAVKQIQEAGAKASAIPVDVLKEDSCRALMADTVKAHGRLDILVNNAGGAGAVAGYAVLRVDPAVIAPDAREAPAGQSAMPPASLTTPAGSDSALAFG